MFTFLVVCSFLSCRQLEVTVPEHFVNNSFWLRHQQADLYVTARGNPDSGVIFINVHGGPALGAQFIALSRPASYQALEEQGIVLYYDQRGIGLSTGHFPASSITLKQFIEDLDQVVEWAGKKYGSQRSIFLLSRSWGGLLSAAYLSEQSRQEKITGWISLSSAHNIPLIREAGKLRLQEVAQQQIGVQQHVAEWESIRTFAKTFDPAVSDFTNLSAYWSYAYQGMLLLSQEGIVREEEPATGLSAEEIYRSTAYSRSEVQQNDAQDLSSLLLQGLGHYSADLSSIQLPTLLVHGAYDLLVPTAVAETAYMQLGTPDQDKFLQIYERSAHLPMTDYENFIQDAIHFTQQYQ